ncbi:ABC transporter permease subunit [Mycoplasmatota bacterium]|nr:ABC transporter permease subunit [Mycoplasmatota bacterium]
MKKSIGLIIIILIWYLFSIVFPQQIPYPQDVIINFFKIFKTHLLIPTKESVTLLFTGLLLSIIVGVHIGILMGLSKRANQMLDPVVYAIYPIPKSTLVQVLIVIFASMFWMKTTLIFIIVVFPVIITVKDAIKNIPKEVFYHAKSLSLNNKDMYKEILIPAILPNLLSTTRISIGTSIAVLYLSETRGIGSGLGYFIDNSIHTSNLNMFTGIFLLSLIGYVLFVVIDILEHKLCKWI